MAIFENLPFTNLHELNLDWIIKKLKQLEDQYPELAKAVKITDLINGEVSTMITNSCQVYKVGSFVYVNIRIKLTDASNLSSDTVLISGLPEPIEETGIMLASASRATGSTPPRVFQPAFVYVSSEGELCFNSIGYISSVVTLADNDFINANFIYIAKE